MTTTVRDKLRSEINRADAAALLPHHRRGALLILSPEHDLLDVAVAIATDDRSQVERWVAEGVLEKPNLAQLADWCVDLELRFQFVILQPFVLAQALPRPHRSTGGERN